MPQGEILLVVIGILLALQVNNWNEKRKELSFEMTLLQELDNALAGDSNLIAMFFEPRMDWKEAAVENFLTYVGEQRTMDEERFIQLYGDLKIDFSYRFNSGPYETIKSAGVDRITNDSLRSELTRIYGVSLPAFKFFIEVVYNNNQPLISQLEQEFIGVSVTKDDIGDWDLNYVSLVNDVLNNPSFLRVLAYERESC